jgi:hypothetical protein
MTGLVFKTHARKVHQLIHGFVQRETSETWIKASERRHNGRLDYFALLAHYGGEGNKAVCIKEAESLRKTLIYKNERRGPIGPAPESGVKGSNGKVHAGYFSN